MAKPNYLDSIDAGLSYIAESKLEEFVATMVTQEKHARAKLGGCWYIFMCSLKHFLPHVTASLVTFGFFDCRLSVGSAMHMHVCQWLVVPCT